MPQPYISVVIPAFNEADWLQACLETLSEQIITELFEVIVVDNNSTDDTALIAGRFPDVRLVSEARKGVCYARQAGLQAARGEIIVSTDADCVFAPDWLAGIAAQFRAQPDMVLRLGNYRFTSGAAWPNGLLGAWESLVLRLKYVLNRHVYVSAANLAFRRSLFIGYDTRLTQGGDELYVLTTLKMTGRVTYDFTRPVRTSPRRLQTGFVHVFFKDFLIGYLLNYWRSRRTGRQSVGYAAHRITQNRHHDLTAYAAGLAVTLAVTALLGYGTYALIIQNQQSVSQANGGRTAVLYIGIIALSLGVVARGLFGPHSQLFGPHIYKVVNNRKLIALTFDDGPNGNFSLDIAAIIEGYGGRASFFQVGDCIARWPEITRELYRRGHVIGNHSQHHLFRDFMRPGVFAAGVKHTSRLLQRVTGESPRYFRSPWLLRTPWLLKTIRAMGMQPVGGTFAIVREFRQPSARVIAERAYRRSKPGAIMIFHDGYNSSGADRTQTVEAVRLLCARLHAEGYQFVGIDALV